MPDTWTSLLERGVQWHDVSANERVAEEICRTFLDRVSAAIAEPRPVFLSEDYLVFTLTTIASNPTTARPWRAASFSSLPSS